MKKLEHLRQNGPDPACNSRRGFASPPLPWLLMLCPALLALTILSLALHVRLGLGHWPVPMIENFDSRAFRLHFQFTTWFALFTAFGSLPLWLVYGIVCRRSLSGNACVLQGLIYLGGWILLILWDQADPYRFIEWLMD